MWGQLRPLLGRVAETMTNADYSIALFLVNWRSVVGYRDVHLPQERDWREELVAVLKEMARAMGG